MEPFVHLASHRIVVYTDPLYQYAVLPSSIDTHLRAQHRMSVGKRRDITNHIMSIPNLIMNEQYLGLIEPNPQPRQPAIPQIPVHSDGLGCSYIPYPFICRSRRYIVDHYHKEHQWINPQKRGGSLRSRQAKIDLWRIGVHCQRLFIRGVPQEYFEVAPVPVQSTISPQSSMANKVK